MKLLSSPFACLICFLLISTGLLADEFSQRGKAVVMEMNEGSEMSSGVQYSADELVASHLALPYGTKVSVLNMENNQRVEVVIRDRGRYMEGKVIDLSAAAAEALGISKGTPARVQIDFDFRHMQEAEQIGTFDRVVESQFDLFPDDVNFTRNTLNGFGVQLGSFENYANIGQVSSRLENELQEAVHVSVGFVDRRKVYKVSVGEFENKHMAEQLRRKLKADFPGCFTVAYP